jgi:7-cyano-7-deazaguanine synthase
VTEQSGLPWQEDLVEALGRTRDLRKLRTIGDERGIEREFRGDAVAVGLERVLPREFLDRERGKLAPAAAARERLRVARKAGTHRFGQRGRKALVAFAEMDGRKDFRFGRAMVGRLGEFQQDIRAANLEGRDIDPGSGGLAPVPRRVKHGETATAEAFAAADAPVVFVGRGKPFRADQYLALALLLEPFEAAERAEFVPENIAQGGQMQHIERGVVEQALAERALRPVCLLAVLVERDAKMLFEQRGKANARPVEQLGREHRVKEAANLETAEIVQQAQVEIAAMHDQVFRRKARPERREVDRRQHIHQEDFTRDVELQQADARSVVEEVIGLGIERHLGRTVEGSKERRKLRGLVDEAVGGRRFQNFNGLVSVFKAKRSFWKPLMNAKLDFFTEDNQGDEAFYRGSVPFFFTFVSFFKAGKVGRGSRLFAFIRGSEKFLLCFLRIFCLGSMFMKVVVLCSGGMDSVTSLHWARREHTVAAAVSFNYGAKHNHREIRFASEHTDKLGLRHEIIALDFVERLFSSTLLKSGGAIPEGHYEADNMRQTVVPFRNAIMLSIATGLAESIGAEGLVIAAHSGDHAVYPDCREEFMHAFAEAMRTGTYAGIKLLRPFIAMNKAQIAAEGARLGVDFARTWSCYKGGTVHCGKCGTCVERREAFILAALPDPTTYESNDPLPEKPKPF